MRLAAVAVIVLATACAKKTPHGPPARCVVKVQLPKRDFDASKAPACSATIVAADATSYADVIAAMDALAKAGFTDFGIGDVASLLPAPPATTTATRTTNEGLVIGRLEPGTTAPMIVIHESGDVMIAGNVIGQAADAKLADEVSGALATTAQGSGAGAAIVIIYAPGSATYGSVLRAARGARKLGYAGMLFGMKQ